MPQIKICFGIFSSKYYYCNFIKDDKPMGKIERDKATVRLMVELYCIHHLTCNVVPEEYKELADYACDRLEHCKYGDAKPACKNCPIHCYAPQQRQRIREIMRWSGPRMIIYSPKALMRHLWQCLFVK
jgi:hypothetical protein